MNYYFMNDANITREYQENNYHLVLICDDSGIFDTYKILRDKLWGGNNLLLSLIYTIPTNKINPLFERELRILNKRFSHNLSVYKLRIDPENFELIQEFIEAVINSNTCTKVQFSVSGKMEFVDYVSGVLRYLNVNEDTIDSQIIS